jgi:hypothetical protein
MKKIYGTILLTLIIILSNGFNTFESSAKASNDISVQNITYYKYDYIWNVDDINLKLENMDNIFVAKIDENGRVYDDDSEVNNMPYTLYKVKLLGNIKGKFSEKYITIAVNGGFDNEGNFHGFNLSDFDNSIDYLPNKNEIYLFSLKDEYKGSIDGEEVYFLNIPEYSIELKDYNLSLGVFNQKDRKVKDVILNHTGTEIVKDDIIGPTNSDITSLMVIDDGGGGGGAAGTDFDSAITLYDNTTSLSYIGATEYKYYKYTTSDTYNTIIETIYYSSNLDTTGYLYDSNRNYLEYDNNDGDGLNFKFERWNNGVTTYYVKMRSTYSDAGYYKIRARKDPDCSCRNDTYLLQEGYDSVYGDQTEMSYKFNFSASKYKDAFNDAVATWNNLGEINIYETTSTFKDVSVELDDVSGADWAAKYSYNWIFQDRIKFNTYYMDTYSDDAVESTALHEIGHALGIDHMHIGAENEHGILPLGEYYTNVMSYDAPNNLIVLGPCERNVYYKLWR